MLITVWEPPFCVFFPFTSDELVKDDVEMPAPPDGGLSSLKRESKLGTAWKNVQKIELIFKN